MVNFLEGSMLVCQGCHNKAAQTGWLQTTDIHCFTVLESRSPKSRCWQGLAPFATYRGDSLLASYSICRQSLVFLAYRLIAPFSASVVTWQFPCVSSHSLPSVYIFASRLHFKKIRTSHAESGFTLLYYNLILTWIHLWRPNFQIRSHVQVGLGLQLSYLRNTI